MAMLRLGIVGAGNRGVMSFGKIFTENHADTVHIVALAEPNPTRAEAAQGLLGLKTTVYGSAHEMFARADIDTVVIASPDYLHEEQCLDAFEHGKHVLVDKPMAISAAGCLRVIEASKRADRVLYMGFNLRHNTVLLRLKQLVDEKQLGDIFSIQAIEHYDGGRSYLARWNRLKKYSGGLFIHKGSHDFDIINWLMGSARPQRVSCFGGVSVFKEENLPFDLRDGVAPGPGCSVCPYATRCPDHYSWADAIENLDPVLGPNARKMWDNGAMAEDNYRKDRCMYLSDKDTHDQGIAIVEYDNGATASHSEYFATPLTNRRYLVEGTRGHGEADLHHHRIEVFPRWTSDRIEHAITPETGGHGGADPKMCAEFARCILQNQRPSASGIDGAWSVAIGEACELARAEKRTVEISEVLDVQSDLLKT